MLKVSKIMKNRNITAYELSKSTGISMCHAYRIISGENEDLKISTLLKISKFLNIPAFMLIEDDLLNLE